MEGLHGDEERLKLVHGRVGHSYVVVELSVGERDKPLLLDTLYKE